MVTLLAPPRAIRSSPGPVNSGFLRADDRLITAPQLLIAAARVAELLVAALLDHLPAVEHDDLVNLVEAIGFVGDKQHGTALGGPQQVGGEGPAAGRVQVSGGLVEDQQRRVGQERAGQGQPLPLATGDRCPVDADRCVQAARQ